MCSTNSPSCWFFFEYTFATLLQNCENEKNPTGTLINLSINASTKKQTKNKQKTNNHINKQWMLLQKGFPLIVLPYLLCCIARPLDTIQDFLCTLGMKPGVHLLEIGIFSLCHVIVRSTLIRNLLKDLKILLFKVIFQC